METFKIINGLSRLNRRDLFDLTGDSLRPGTRGNDCPKNIIPRACRLDIRRNFFTNRVSKSWNELPTDIKMSPSLKLFKFNLKEHLLNIRLVELETNDDGERT